MSLVVMAQTQNTLKEYFLPAVNNTDYALVLEMEPFELEKELSVGMEVIQNEWSFIKSEEYQMIDQNRRPVFGRRLRDGNLFFLQAGGVSISLLVVESKSAFQIMNKYDIGSLNEIVIGSGSGCQIRYELFQYISGQHVVLRKTGNVWNAQDVSRNGAFINGTRMHASTILEFGDCMTIFGLRIVFLGEILAVSPSYGKWRVEVSSLAPYEQLQADTPVCSGDLGKQLFKRSPRTIEKLYTDSIEIEAPPAVRNIHRKPLFMSIGPSFTMAVPMLLGSGMAIMSNSMRGGSGGLYMFTGLITAVSSAAVGIFWALSNLKYEKNVEREEQERRYNSYGMYLQNKADFIREKYQYNTEVLKRMYQSAAECCRYDRNNTALWNRNFGHEDFLWVRLGIGNEDFQAEIVTPKQKFSMDMDDLGEKPDLLKNNYITLYQVPVGIDLLKKRLIGITGGSDKDGAIRLMWSMAAQLAVNNCYTDVKMVFIYRERSKKQLGSWAFAKWLPHVWSDDKKTRFVASNKKEVGDVCYELTKILRDRTKDLRMDKPETVIRPHFVLFIEDMELLAGELLMKYILEPKREYGITAILMEESYADLPNECEDIIRNDGVFCIDQVQGSQKKEIVFDTIMESELEQLARRLSDIEVNVSAAGGEIPASLDFFEMYGVSGLKELHILERWTKNRTFDSMKVPIGKKSGGADCYLDIHEKYHGPHGLVAGTTGSGKSETLQTYMLSLAVNFSPYDIGFFIIDFKGGGMANLFSNLPHLIGQISNLSGNQVRRAMISIKSENKRRQRIFTEHSVNNINLYTRLYKNGEAKTPVPHLFIIIDEFAELKREEPEFMKELISVAQVGRSLGVHLILATQKPGGTVDDNIWSNTKFRVCLRVQDRQDSNDMLHKPDAAYITQAGRGYLQVGNDEIYELFQSGYSGAVYDPDSGGEVSIATMLTLTGKAAIIGNRTKKKRMEDKKKQWLTVLIRMSGEILWNMNTDAESITRNEQMFDSFLDTLVDALAGQGYEYEKTAYNCARIQDFLQLWEPNTKDPAVLAEHIMEKAVQQHRKLPELKEQTQLDAVTEYLGAVARENGYKQNLALWLPVLPDMLGLERLNGFRETAFADGQWKELSGKWTLNACIGLYDDPENQQQEPLTVDFAENGHYAVCGTVVTGKSTFLQTLLYSLIVKYTPDQFWMYLLDYSSRMLSVFEEDRHTGGVVYDTDYEKTARFFHMLEKLMEERKSLFKGANYSQYVQANGVVVPAVLVVIDNFAGFKEKTENAYENLLIRLSREGVGYGIFLLVSSAGFGPAEIPNRIRDNIRTVIALELGDRFKTAEVLRAARIEIMPETDVKGRGLAYVDGRILEFQTAVALETEDDYKRAEYIRARCSEMSLAWRGEAAARIPEIPDKPLLSEFMQMKEYRELNAQPQYLPVGYELSDASICAVDLQYTYSYIISGRPRTGKTNVLKLLIHAAAQKEAQICIIENSAGELRKTAENVHARYLSEDREIFEYFSDSVPIFKERNQFKHSLLAEGLGEREVYARMQEKKPIFIFVASLTEFIQSVYRKLEDGRDMNRYLENITEKGFLHNIFFFSCLNTDEIQKVLGMKVYTNMTSAKMGMHLGGDLHTQKIFQFANIPYAEQTKTMKAGQGLTPSYEDGSIARTIVLPLAKGV